MGSFLDKPVTEKDLDSGEREGLRYGMGAMQGWRVDMEDAHAIALELDEDHPDMSFFGVFDGHGGTVTAQYSASRIVNKIKSTDEFKRGELNEALVTAFLELDDELRKSPLVTMEHDRSGSTACSALISKTELRVANIGDSRAVLCRGGKAVAMSEDHKPYNPDERRRIERAGGNVTLRRVGGDLAVSRALGDFLYKMNSSLPAREQQVSPEPEVRVEARHDDDEFLVLACDGVWDVMSNAECVAFVRDTLTCYSDLGRVCARLLDEALNRGSRDNISAIIIAFPACPKVDPARETKALEEDKLRMKEDEVAATGMEDTRITPAHSDLPGAITS